MSYITCYEYETNVNPSLNNIPIVTKNIHDCVYGINFIELSNIYNVDYKSTSPNLLASFIKIEVNNQYESGEKNSYLNGSSHLFYIINGSCEFILDNEIHLVSSGDIFISPVFHSCIIRNISNGVVSIYYINDSPLINYLGAECNRKIFKPSIYSKEYILHNLQKLSNPNSNRKGILLSNLDTEKIGINTITPILWSLYNELPPNTNQKPHKHNSVALDLCIESNDPGNIYTLVGDELDEHGNIVNPTKISWNTSEMFITPPGLWHSHHNLGNTYAYILPIQDAGLLLYQRILGIVLT